MVNIAQVKTLTLLSCPLAISPSAASGDWGGCGGTNTRLMMKPRAWGVGRDRDKWVKSDDPDTDLHWFTNDS